MENIYKKPDADLVSKQTDEEMNNIALYKISGIGVATFFGTAVAGGYLAFRNLKSLGRDKEAKNALIAGVITAVVIIVLAIVVDEFLNLPGTVVSITQMVIMTQISKQWFEADLEVQIDEGGKLYSNWRAFGISLIIFTLILVLLSPLLFFLV